VWGRRGFKKKKKIRFVIHTNLYGITGRVKGVHFINKICSKYIVSRGYSLFAL
jgi:hypothetical protein